MSLKNDDKCHSCPHICDCCANKGDHHACGECYVKTRHEFKPKAHIVFCPLDGNKLEAEKNNPLTIEELARMQDKAVWVQPKGDPLNGNWGVVESATEINGNKYLYLWGHLSYYLIDEDYEAFSTQQM